MEVLPSLWYESSSTPLLRERRTVPSRIVESVGDGKFLYGIYSRRPSLRRELKDVPRLLRNGTGVGTQNRDPPVYVVQEVGMSVNRSTTGPPLPNGGETGLRWRESPLLYCPPLVLNTSNPHTSRIFHDRLDRPSFSVGYTSTFLDNP